MNEAFSSLRKNYAECHTNLISTEIKNDALKKENKRLKLFLLVSNIFCLFLSILHFQQ